MSDIDILSIEPYKVSRDMRGHSVFFYGGWKTGKTYTASKFPKALILAFEKGYSALPGVRPQPINSWADFKKVLRQLKQPKAHEMYETIIIDTADIAYNYCTKYVCTNNGVDKVGDIPYGGGYGLVEQEFDEALRQIVMMDYGLVAISHDTDKTFTDENGNQFNKIVPTLDKRANNVIARMCDVIGYTRSIPDETGKEQVYMFMRGTSRFEAGSRFKYTPDSILLSYKNLVDAICDALDKQAAEEGVDYFTDERRNVYEEVSFDFDALMGTFSSTVSHLIESNSEEDFETKWAPRVQEIVERTLGKGKKVNMMTRDQAELLSVIVDELTNLVNNTK